MTMLDLEKRSRSVCVYLVCDLAVVTLACLSRSTIVGLRRYMFVIRSHEPNSRPDLQFREF